MTAIRASNIIGYFLPRDLGGIYGQVQYYLGENPSNVPTKRDGTGAGARLGYAAGPLDAAVALSKTRYAAGDVEQNNIAASWDFGVLKLMGQYSFDKSDALKARGTGGMLGIMAPVGSGEIHAAFSKYKVTTAGDPTTSKLAIGYKHHLSKRTALYVTVAGVDNKGGAAQVLNGALTAPNAKIDCS